MPIIKLENVAVKERKHVILALCCAIALTNSIAPIYAQDKSSHPNNKNWLTPVRPTINNIAVKDLLEAMPGVSPARSPSNISISENTPNTLLTQPKFELYGQVTESLYETPAKCLDEIVGMALERDLEAQKAAAKKSGHKGIKKVAYGSGKRVKEIAQFVTAYQGFESSSEAADIILNEKVKLKSHAAVDLVHQSKIDSAHTRACAAMMQVCYALGIDDPQKRDKSLASGRTALIEMVGEDKADETIKLLSNWSNDVHVNPDSFNRDQLDILEMEDSTKNLIAFGLEGDSVVKEIKDKLHKYNRHSKFASATAKVVNTTLSVVMLSPTILSPAAQAAQLVFVALTGGPEEAKLLKEVYLDRRFESRYKRLNAEANLAVSNYNRALSTKNPVLLAFSESIANNISGKASILEANKQAELDKADIAQAAEEAASKKKLKAHKTKTTQKEKLSLNKTQKESN